MSDRLVTVKAGDDINWYFRWLVNDIPQDLDDFDVSSQVRSTSGDLAFEFDVTVLDQETDRGCFILSAPASASASLRQDVYDCDVSYRNVTSGQIETMETFLIEFVKRITRSA